MLYTFIPPCQASCRTNENVQKGICDEKKPLLYGISLQFYDPLKISTKMIFIHTLRLHVCDVYDIHKYYPVKQQLIAQTISLKKNIIIKQL